MNSTKDQLKWRDWKDGMLIVAVLLMLAQLLVFLYTSYATLFYNFSGFDGAWTFFYDFVAGLVGLIYSIILMKTGRGRVLITNLLLVISVFMVTILPKIILLLPINLFLQLF